MSSYMSIAAITNHSETLRKIEFPCCHDIGSGTIQAILVTCKALEILQVQNEVSGANSNLAPGCLCDRVGVHQDFVFRDCDDFYFGRKEPGVPD